MIKIKNIKIFFFFERLKILLSENSRKRKISQLIVDTPFREEFFLENLNKEPPSEKEKKEIFFISYCFWTGRRKI